MKLVVDSRFCESCGEAVSAPAQPLETSRNVRCSAQSRPAYFLLSSKYPAAIAAEISACSWEASVSCTFAGLMHESGSICGTRKRNSSDGGKRRLSCFVTIQPCYGTEEAEHIVEVIEGRRQRIPIGLPWRDSRSRNTKQGGGSANRRNLWTPRKKRQKQSPLLEYNREHLPGLERAGPSAAFWKRDPVARTTPKTICLGPTV